MRKDEAVAADAGIVADDDGLRRIDVGHLQHYRSVAEHEPGFGKLRAADVHLLADARILADLDVLAGRRRTSCRRRVAADAYPPPLHDGEQPDLDVVAELDVAPMIDAAKGEAHAAARSGSRVTSGMPRPSAGSEATRSSIRCRMGMRDLGSSVRATSRKVARALAAVKRMASALNAPPPRTFLPLDRATRRRAAGGVS